MNAIVASRIPRKGLAVPLKRKQVLVVERKLRTLKHLSEFMEETLPWYSKEFQNGTESHSTVFSCHTTTIHLLLHEGNIYV